MRSILCCALLVLSTPVLAVDIDGRIDAAEWAQARHVTDFRLTEPLSREAAPLQTEAWILATERGLAVAFRNTQPAGVARNRQRGQRDRVGATDRINLYVDFDGDGRSGYNFTVSLANSITDATITNESQFNGDWDGHWLHATSEDDEGWSAEILLPWHIAPMRAATGGERVMRIGLDRVIAATAQRMSWPAVGFTEPRFLSVLEPVTVPAHGQSLLALTPYVSMMGDAVGDADGSDAGVDLFWKPSGLFQLSATLNPDFGQVESDELVVNFSATESFFSDRRPFFTENQGFFDVPFGALNGRNRLLYTRRVSGDVAAAAKVNGSTGGFNYGAFTADEKGAGGRDFHALRVTRDFAAGNGSHGLGAMATRVVSPLRDRVADVYEADHRWANERWNVRSTLVASTVDQRGVQVRDSGAQVLVDHDLGGNWRQQFYALHIGKHFELNDFGYLERNNFNYLRYDLARRVTELPASSKYTGHDWHYAVSHRSNDQGEHIAWAAATNRRSSRRDGGSEFFDVAIWSAGQDDLILRGAGIVEMPAKLMAVYQRTDARRGAWQWFGQANYSADGFGTLGQGRIGVGVEPSYFFNDDLSVSAGMELSHHPQWLLWRQDNLLATYRSRMASFSAGLTWLLASRQELRVRLEAIGLDAEARQAWRVVDRKPLASSDPIADFSLRNLAFQMRYRYELAPLSYLYVAYVRGGAMYEEALDQRFGLGSTFGNAFALRDSEQLLLKLSYRFEI